MGSGPDGFPPIARPTRRPLKIFALDPGFGRTTGNLAEIEVGYEPLLHGPEGRLVRVVDYDASADRYYPPVDLDSPDILIRGGLDPSESDPRFHQQMVYAVTMMVLENCSRALGRPFRFHRNRKLTILPHAYEGDNAFYDPTTHTLAFGYFSAAHDDPGPNLPGQTVFTCLSHDIVAHETTHAVVHRLREHFDAPTNRDVLAFHEGVADIVSIFQHFTFEEVVRHHIRATRTQLAAPGPLLELAKQFGYTTGRGGALRSALDTDFSRLPDPTLYHTATEPHRRGGILVAAVFDAFFTSFRNRIAGILRASTSGSGLLPPGELQSDLLALVTAEARAASQSILTMCLRAFEYLPPVDVTFGDYLRALVTADFELNPHDAFGTRAALIEGFRRRGIYAPGTASLAEESLRWEEPPSALRADPLPDELIQQVLAADFPMAGGNGPVWRAPAWGVLKEYGRRHARELQLGEGDPVEVQGFHTSFRIDEDGKLHVELVAQWLQTPPDDGRRIALGGVFLRGGTTVVFGHDGAPRYVVAKPMPGATGLAPAHRELADRRVAAFHDYVHALDDADPLLTWSSREYHRTRMAKRAQLRRVHRGRWLEERR
jgi:hypothetical protein